MPEFPAEWTPEQRAKYLELMESKRKPNVVSVPSMSLDPTRTKEPPKIERPKAKPTIDIDDLLLDEPYTKAKKKTSEESADATDLPKAVFESHRGIREGLINKINKKHALIENIGGKTLIASLEPSLVSPGQECIVFQSVACFRLRYSNELVPGLKVNAKPKKLGDFWIDHATRRQYRGVVFKPSAGEVVNGCWNMWRGWGVEAKPGDWSLMRRHIEEVIADNDPKAAEYIIHWIAWAIQHPDRPAEVALVLIGHKGAGKGTLIRILQLIFGAHSFQVSSQEHIVGRFNAHQRDCVLFIADESFWAGDKRVIGALQRMITEPTLSIEQKGIDLVEVPNMLHMIMLAEHGWVAPAGQRERRYAPFNVNESRLGDRAYFDALHAGMGQAAAAMLYDLQRMDLGKWHPRQVYETAALVEQKRHSLSLLEEWYESLLQSGVLLNAVSGRPDTVLTANLLSHARAFHGLLRHTVNETRIGIFLKGMGCKKYSDGIARGWTFQALAEARAQWEIRYGKWPWDEPELKEWVSSTGALGGSKSVADARVIAFTTRGPRGYRYSDWFAAAKSKAPDLDDKTFKAAIDSLVDQGALVLLDDGYVWKAPG